MNEKTVIIAVLGIAVSATTVTALYIVSLRNKLKKAKLKLDDISEFYSYLSEEEIK